MSDEGEKKAAEAGAAEVSGKPKYKRNMFPVYLATVAIVFLAVGFFSRGSITGNVILPSVSAQEVGEKCAAYINENLVQPGTSASVVGVEDAGSMYIITLSYMGQNISVYASKDGQYLIPGNSYVLDMNKPLPKSTDGTEPATGEIPKSDTPTVELFVMSFCPYGVQAEQALAPVVDLLGDKAGIKVRFIASASGSDISSIQSLHGNIEGVEDARQLCIAKNYDTATYWKYLSGINSDCYPIYRNGEAAYDTCWKVAAAKAGIDTVMTESCMSSEGVSLINAESAAADGYGVSGSPTLIINGARYNGARTPEAFKAAICGAFNEAPSECGQTLSAAGSETPSGGCG